MIKHAVKHDSYVILMKSLAHLGEILVRPEALINHSIVAGVISVCVRFKYRRKIDCRYPELLKMGNPINNRCYILITYSVILKRRIAKPKWIYLIKYRFLCPHNNHYTFTICKMRFPPIIYCTHLLHVPIIILQNMLKPKKTIVI